MKNGKIKHKKGTKQGQVDAIVTLRFFD